MKPSRVLGILALTACPALLAGTDAGTASLLHLPLSFEANAGQVDPQVRFMARQGGQTLFLTDREAVLSLRGSRGPATLRMGFEGAATTPSVEAEEPQEGKVNYLLGNDPSRWHAGVPTFAKVRYRDLYPGTDLVYYGRDGRLEYDLLLAPKADPGRIRLAMKGASGLRIDGEGGLVVKVAGGELHQPRPTVYQEMDGARIPVEARFRLLGRNRVGFRLGAYDHARPLVIDPSLLYSTYLGGTNGDTCTAVAVDGSGSAYITGFTTSTDFPTASQISGIQGLGTDGFVTKLNPAGTAMVYSSYIGGAGADTPYGIAVDANGNAYIAGTTSSTDFPLKNAAQSTHGGGGNDGFLTRISSTGGALVYSTYWGGNGNDNLYGIAVRSTGTAYAVGSTTSTNLPRPGTPFQYNYGGSQDAFIVIIAANGDSVCASYLGGSGGDGANGVAVDSQGNAYVVGSTTSTNFPATGSAYQGSNAGSVDAFVAKINSTGTTLTYCTYLGGTFDDVAYGVAVDGSYNAYVTGSTSSTGFPTSNPYQANHAADGGTRDIFITKLNAAGTGLGYSTYLGGDADDWGKAIAVDGNGNAWVTGRMDSQNFSTAAAIQPKPGNGYNVPDTFIAELGSAGNTLPFFTFLGGSYWDYPGGIALDGNGNCYVAGTTSSTDFPVISALQPVKKVDGGLSDTFITKLRLNASDPTLSGVTVSGTRGVITLNATATGVNPITSVKWYVDGTLKGADSTSAYMLSLDSTTLTDGKHTLIARAVDNTGLTTDFIAPPFTVDNNAPTVSAAESGIKGSITFSATATDSVGVSLVRWYVDGVLKGADSSNPYSIHYTSTGLADGAHNLTATATDTTGNIGTSTSVPFIVDNNPPTAVTASETGTSGTIFFDATATDTAGVAIVRWYVDGVLKGADSTAPYHISFNSTTLANGSHGLYVRATDLGGNITQSSTVNFSVSN